MPNYSKNTEYHPNIQTKHYVTFGNSNYNNIEEDDIMFLMSDSVAAITCKKIEVMLCTGVVQRHDAIVLSSFG